MRQLTDSTGAVTFARTYDPYGVTTTATGNSASAYGFTNEYHSQGLIYLRARHYAPGMGRFLTRDTWPGEVNRPLSLNRWGYVEANPLNFVDPTGKVRFSTCFKPTPFGLLNSYLPACQSGLTTMHGLASELKERVTSGAIKPVEAFAMLADLSQTHFKGDIADTVWAMTIVLNDFDANRAMISPQVWFPAGSPYYIKQDWLPYLNNPDPKYGDKQPWCDPYNEKDCLYNRKWIHSLRGDWNAKYWDKTANQAYHFWGILAITFFDGAGMGNLANEVHEKGWQEQGYDFIGSDPGQAPPHHGVSKPDYDLSLRSIELGSRLRREHRMQSLFYSYEPQLQAIWNNSLTNIGEWVRNNLKE